MLYVSVYTQRNVYTEPPQSSQIWFTFFKEATFCGQNTVVASFNTSNLSRSDSLLYVYKICKL